MFVNAELELLEEELHQKLHCCNRAVIRPNPWRSFCVKSRFVSPSASERIRQKLYCLVIGLKKRLLWCTSERAKVNDM